MMKLQAEIILQRGLPLLLLVVLDAELLPAEPVSMIPVMPANPPDYCNAAVQGNDVHEVDNRAL